jgi:osmotically-inducible protein OsmY
MPSQNTWSFVAGFVVGGVTVALLDRRRARGARSVRQRLRGLVYRAKAGLENEMVPDDVLIERVRAEMGRPLSNPAAILVRAQDGCVVLAGPISADEADELIRCVSGIPGVRSIESELELQDEPDEVSSLPH